MRPLQGITVVSLEQAIAAPYASRHLADLGARVIKLERPGVGDFARGYDARVDGLSSHFVWTNRSKESLTLDIKDPRGLDVARRLLASADVFLQNLAPGATARAGLGAEELQRDQPRARRLRHLRLRGGRPVRVDEGVRPDGAGRGRAALGHRLARRRRQGRHLGLRHRRRDVRLQLDPRGAARARAGPAAGRTSTSRCWRRRWSGWGSRSTTPTTGPSRRRGRAPRTRRSTRTGRSPPATAWS